MGHRADSEKFAKALLSTIREFTHHSDIQSDSLPRWLRAANIRIAEVNGSTIVFFERTPKEQDEVVEYREVFSDVEFVFPNRTSSCGNTLFTLSNWENDEPGLSSIVGGTLSITSPVHCFTDIYKNQNHISLIFLNSFFMYQPHDEIEEVRYVPFALLFPSQHLSDFGSFWDSCAESLLQPIVSIQSHPMMEYRTEPMAEKGILSSVKDTVIILGNYDDPFEEELRQIRDYLISLGYDAFLIKDLPGQEEMSLEEKVKLWTTASRFCIMVDREASGHVKEYEIVKSERKPLALLRPQGGGSTWMIGDDELVDLNYIKTFEFSGSPIETAEAGVRWAEDLLNERGKAYPEFYPWKEVE